MARPDQEPSSKSPVDILDAEIRQHLKGAEAGSPQLLAFGDVYRENRLRRIWLYQTQELSENPPKSRIRNDSALRTTELEMAILNQQIANREMEVNGYSHHYTYLTTKWYQLTEACVADMRANSPNGTTLDIKNHGMSLFEDITTDIKSSIVDNPD